MSNMHSKGLGFDHYDCPIVADLLVRQEPDEDEENESGGKEDDDEDEDDEDGYSE